MSNTPVTHRVVEWSPNEVVGFDAATKQAKVAPTLADLTAEYGGGSIIAAVSRRTTFVKAVRVPNAAASEIDLILRTQMATMFPVPLTELAYSFRMTEDVNEEGRLAVVAAMRESDLQSLQSQAKAAGFKVERVIPSAFGSMLLAESLGHKDAAVAQDTREGLAIDLLAGGELRYSRLTPMPANPAMIESEITRSFQAVGLPCAPTIAAGGFPYADAEYKSSTPTLEMLATLPLEKLGINLETHEVRDKREKAKQANRVRFAALLCASALLVALMVYLDWADRSEGVRRASANWQRDLGKLRTNSKRLEGDLTKVQATRGSIERAFKPAQTPGDILTQIANHAPKGLWLTGITFERGKLMFIRGTAVNSEAVTSYLQNLTGESRLRDVKLVFANNGDIDKTPVVQFSIQAFPVGNLPLVDAKKKGAKS